MLVTVRDFTMPMSDAGLAGVNVFAGGAEASTDNAGKVNLPDATEIVVAGIRIKGVGGDPEVWIEPPLSQPPPLPPAGGSPPGP